jgi:replicative DNA helicase
MHALTEDNLYNIEAETAVLGSIFYEPELIKECPLNPGQFSPGRHANLFHTMRLLDSKDVPIDMVTMIKTLGSKLDRVGGIEYINEISASMPTAANFKFYCDIVIEFYQKRRAIQISNDIKQAAIDGNPLDAIQAGVTDLMEIEESGTDEDDGEIKEALFEMFNDIEGATGEINGIITGFNDLDRMTGGLKGGQFGIIAARPSIGKTAFALNIATNAAYSALNENGDVVAVFSLEMAKKELLKRCAATIGNINAQSMKSAGISFTAEDWGKLTNAMDVLAKSDVKIFDKAGIDVNYIWSKVRKLKRQNPGRRIMVIIDYLQLIQGSKKHNGNRQAEIGEISRTLKTMARKLGVVVIALSQLSRGVESRQDKRPMMSDIRESGQIEQDADIIAFLYRDDYYDKESENKNIIEVIIAKHRDGPVGLVNLAFIKEYGKFVNLERRSV